MKVATVSIIGYGVRIGDVFVTSNGDEFEVINTAYRGADKVVVYGANNEAYLVDDEGTYTVRRFI